MLTDFLIGSYSRNTMIAPLPEADIDIVLVLDSEYWKQDGYAALLDSIKATLGKTYANTIGISRNGQAVTIVFNDFQVDVVPAFNRTGGGFLIPDTHGKRWIGTNPKRQVEISSEKNGTHNGGLVPLVKMVKQWNKTISFPFRSFHLEVLAWSIFDGVTITDYPSGVRYFFDKAREEVKKQNPDPAGYNDDVGAYLNQSNLPSAVSHLETALNRALGAEQYAAAGRNSLAFEEWRKVFGDKFPAYS